MYVPIFILNDGILQLPLPVEPFNSKLVSLRSVIYIYYTNVIGEQGCC